MTYEALYQQGGAARWDVGRAQQVYVELAESGEIQSPVLDAGCGTGDNALFLTGRGYEVMGVDVAPTAIRQARAKADERGLTTPFAVADALALGGLGRTFATIIDSGLFHVFSDDDRLRYAQSLRAALLPGATYFMLCFSDRETEIWGPRRVSQDEIRATFGAGWRVNYIREAPFLTTIERPAPGWFSSITRVG